ncbi:MAG: glycosyltransferase [Austwickia sp.]|nr:glycosyltransferase [Austwickia sp.]
MTDRPTPSPAVPTSARPEQPVVAVWRSLWLPASETFVRDHVRSLTGWHPLLLGLAQVDDRLGLRPDVAPFGESGWRRKVGRLSRLTGYAGVYGAALRRADARLLHAHFGTDAVECLPLAARHRIPLAVTFHGYDATSAPLRPPPSPYPHDLRRVFAAADILLPVSHFIAGRLIDLGAPAERVHVHYLGIPRQAPRAVPSGRADSARGGVSDAEPGLRRIVFVGRLVEGKGVEDLLAAFGALPPPLRACSRLDIVGDGDRRAALESQAAAIEGQVVFHGRLAPEQVTEILETSTVFVGPSHPGTDGWNEGLGLVFLEAGRAGLPVISHRTGGVPEAVIDGETGLLTPVGDLGALTEALRRVLEDPELSARMGCGPGPGRPVVRPGHPDAAFGSALRRRRGARRGIGARRVIAWSAQRNPFPEEEP